MSDAGRTDRERADGDAGAGDERIGVAVAGVGDALVRDAVVEALSGAGYEVVTREGIARRYDGVQSAVDALVSRDDVSVVVTTGGVGVAPDDVTVDALAPLFEKELPGFGELVRARYRERVGTAVVGVRATAGVADGVPVFCLPDDAEAAEACVEEVVAPEAGRLAAEAAPETDEG